jgi:N-methylhydantoinase B/oxoprolinase/acetone carboxylase alpha subunit
VETSGGGGFGRAADRDPQGAAADLRDGKTTSDAAGAIDRQNRAHER